jgi:hypothetical protein
VPPSPKRNRFEKELRQGASLLYQKQGGCGCCWQQEYQTFLLQCCQKQQGKSEIFVCCQIIKAIIIKAIKNDECDTTMVVGLEAAYRALST